MKKIFTIILLTSILIGFSGCALQRAINMKDCKYSFGGVSGITWANINFLKIGTDKSALNVKTLTDCATALAKKDFSTKITLDINAKNPESRDAAIAGFDYQVYYKDIMIGTGESANTSEIVVPALGSTTIPADLHVSFKDIVDLKKPLTAVDNTLKFIKEISKIGKSDTDFSVKIRPHLKVGKKTVKTAFIKLDL